MSVPIKPTKRVEVVQVYGAFYVATRRTGWHNEEDAQKAADYCNGVWLLTEAAEEVNNALSDCFGGSDPEARILELRAALVEAEMTLALFERARTASGKWRELYSTSAARARAALRGAKP